MIKKYLKIVSILFVSLSVQAQNPFSSFLSDEEAPEILTVSKGKFQEVIGNDTIIRIGSVMFDRHRGVVVQFLQLDTMRSEAALEPEVVSRFISPDPMNQYASPYLGMGNNPIMLTDPTGGETSPIYSKEGKFLGVDSEGFQGDIIIMDEYIYGVWQNVTGNEVLDHSITSTYGAGMSSVSSPEVMSKIFTHVLQNQPDINLSGLYNDKVSIQGIYSSNNYNIPPGSGGTSRYSMHIPTKRLTVRENYADELSSVEMVWNFLGMHEWQGHAINKHRGNQHYKAYELQLNHHTFPKLPTEFQNEIRQHAVPSSPRNH